ncbi:MAG: hypothetical protein A3F40_02940 [Chlamydiae bacterium RIFCSPHIGHO2_12_FULL_27_8]|nr:MAG: hypothetical protein A3F40_02940 [Chlamydiae bacterium RIFCSPHIGHO2_12_FULL_27_8]
MTYIKSLLINCLTVFFVNQVIPDVAIDYYSKLPKIGGDIIFSFGLGFIGSLIFPFIILFKIKPSHFKVGLSAFVISYFAYSIVNLLPVGIKVSSAKGYLIASSVVWLMFYFTNHLELKRYLRSKEDKMDMKGYNNEEQFEDKEENKEQDRDK